jgi:IS5 family transposase
MCKIVLLQQWYGLSDPGAEEAVRDRLSFRRFCGLPLDEETPDHSSRQLDARGLVVKRGTLVDATIISAGVKRPAFEDGQVNPRDPDASFTVKKGETHFGYKAHLAVDEESGVVRQAEMSSADLHDSQRGEALIQGDEKAYYADKAYDSRALRAKLAEMGIEDRIAYKARRNKPLVNWQAWFNKTASTVRVGVERANATMKNWYGMARVRYRGLARNHCHLQFVAMAMNMKRARVLLAAA